MTSLSPRFGTDGWRGLIADDFTFANLGRVSHAAARYIHDAGYQKSEEVLVGFDRRFLSHSFAEEVASLLRVNGIQTRVAQFPMPTPALSLSVVNRHAAWGIMITASHNPALYNGFKVKDRSGRSAPPEVTRAIETFIEPEAPTPGSSRSPNPATLPAFDDSNLYLQHLRSQVDWKLLKRFRGKVVFDHMHGCSSGIPERLFKGCPIECLSLHESDDALFGGLHPEPIEEYLKELKETVRITRSIVGIACDGDADRLGIVDDEGRYLTPHQVFPLIVLHCAENKKWKGKVVQSVSLGALGERIAQAFNLPFEEVPVGFKHVAERMLREDILAGGEESGGYAVRGGLPERDGILSGLLFLEIIATSGKKPSRLVADMEKRFGKARFKRVDLPLGRPIAQKEDFTRFVADQLPKKLAGASVRETRTQDGVKVVLQSGAWVLLRPSGTEPLVRTYAESQSWPQTESLLAWAKKSVQSYFSKAP